eukprot:scaffold14195_cov155-Skeletonema_dohrnii-CCMP3373.AAC.14
MQPSKIKKGKRAKRNDLHKFLLPDPPPFNKNFYPHLPPILFTPGDSSAKQLPSKSMHKTQDHPGQHQEIFTSKSREHSIEIN